MRSRVFLSVALIPLVMVLLRGGNGGVDIIVKLRKGHSVRELSENYGTRKAGYLANRGIWLIHVDDSTNGQAVLHKIQKEPAVEDAEIDRRVKLTSARLANVSPELVQDMMALLDGQTMTSFNGTTVLKAYAEQRAMTVIGADQVRKISTGAGTRVAYIDTGVDPYHPALRPWLEPGVDLLNNRSTSELDGLSDAGASLLDDAGASLLDKRFFFILDDAGASLLDGGNNDAVF